MLSISDLVNIFLPVLSHFIIWLIFLVIVIIVLILYAYPYVRKPDYMFSFLSIYKFYSEKFFNIKKSNKEDINYHKRILIASIISLYIFTKMLEGVIYSGAILKVDAIINSVVYSPLLTSIASFITNFGAGVLITVLVIVIIGALVLRKRWRYALLSIIAILGATLLQVVIKALIQRIRPPNLIETGFSFPSGHAITAIVFVSLLIYSFKNDFKNKIAKYVLIITASAFFTAVGISRIILHVHWFSDVIAGFSLGLFWFMLLVLVERAIPGVIPAVKKETKEAEPIVPEKVTETAKKIAPVVLKK